MRALLMLVLGIAAIGPGGVPQAGTPQTAGERYKSVRVLKDAPAGQMIEIMSVIAGSLGVTCAHCHEADFASDAKPMKQKARDMILLTRSVDASFGGRGAVTCNTCHQGSAVPPPMARVEQAAWMKAGGSPDPQAPLPSADAVLGRYVTALGGREQLRQVKGRVVTGKVTRDNGRTGPVSGIFMLTQEMPGTLRMETGFSYPPEGASELNSEFFRARRAEDLASRSRVIGRGVVRSRPTVVVEVAGTAEARGYRLHFDESTGLLVARESEKETPLGLLAERHEISDYRRTGEIQQPFRFDWMRADYHVTFQISEVNVR